MKRSIWRGLTTLALTLVLVVGLATEARALSGTAYDPNPGEGFVFKVSYYCPICRASVYEESTIEGHSLEITSFNYTIENGKFSWNCAANVQGCKGSYMATNTESEEEYNCTKGVTHQLDDAVNGNPEFGYLRVWLQREATAHQGGATCVTEKPCTLCGTNYKADHVPAQQWETDPDAKKHYHKCTQEGCTVRLDEDDCTYSAATCTAASVCSVCDHEYAGINPEAHSYGGWASKGDGTHTRTCSLDNTHTENDNCSGGVATCSALAVCEGCNTAYGDTLPHSLVYSKTADNVLMEECSNADCDHSAAVTLSASDSTYTGSPIAGAAVEYDENWQGINKPTEIIYTNNTNAGIADASITVEGVELTTNFTIAPALLDDAVITLTQNSYTYDGNPHKPGYSVALDGFGTLAEGVDYEAICLGARKMAGGEVVQWFGNPMEGVGADGINAGTYGIIIRGMEDGNFQVSEEKAKIGAYELFTIDPAEPTVTPPTAKENLTYTGQAQELFTPGSTSLGTMQYSTAENGTYGEEVLAETDAGTYTIWYRAEVLNETNYKTSQPRSIEVTIARTRTDYSAPKAITGLVYAGTPQNLISAGTATGGTMYYAITDSTVETAPAEVEAWSTTVPAQTAAKTYRVWYRIDGDENHNDIAPDYVDVTIAPKPVTPAAVLADTGKSVPYDGTAKTPEPTVTCDGINETLPYELSYADNINAGTATVTVSPKAGSNYTFKPIKLSFTITKLTPTADLFSFTAPTDLTYNGKAKNAGIDWTLPEHHTGLGNVTVKYCDAKGNSVAPVNARTYTVKLDIAEGTNYKAVSGLTSEGWNFTVNKAPLMLTCTATGKTYDGTTAVKVKLKKAEGLAGSEKLVEGVDYTITAAFADANAGKDKIVDYTVTLKSKAAGNYIIAGSNMVTAEIKKAPLTLTADSFTVKTGDPKPALTYTAGGLIGKDKLTTEPTLTCAAFMKVAGDYTITISDAVADNYAITYQNGTLRVRDEHSVKAEAGSGGSVSVDPGKAKEGDTVTVKPDPKWGYRLKSLVVTDANGKKIPVSVDEMGNLAFTMPDAKVTVEAEFCWVYSGIADSTNPKTGDTILPALAMLPMSMLALAFLLAQKKRRQ